MTNKVTVYTKTPCVQCEYTQKFLADNDIPFESIPISTVPHIADELKESGNLQMPYVITPHGEWHGFKIDNLRGLDKRDFIPGYDEHPGSERPAPDQQDASCNHSSAPGQE